MMENVQSRLLPIMEMATSCRCDSDNQYTNSEGMHPSKRTHEPNPDFEPVFFIPRRDAYSVAFRAVEEG